MERKEASKKIDFEIKNISVTKDGTGTTYIEGYANTVTKDRVGDSVLPKAFSKSLPEYQKNPVLLYQHNWDMPIGSVPVLKIDEHGLWIRGKVSNASDVSDIKTKIQDGTLRTLSIGYNELDSEYDETTKTKIVKELELLEISVVTIPANTEAIFRPVEQVDGDGKAYTVVLSDRVARLIDDEKALPAVAAFLNQMQKGATMSDQTKPAQKAAGDNPAAANPDAAGDAQDMGKKMNEMHGCVKEMHAMVKGMADQIKAIHEAVKKPAADAYQYPAPKSLEQMSDQEVDAALAAESAELARLNSVATN